MQNESNPDILKLAIKTNLFGKRLLGKVYENTVYDGCPMLLFFVDEDGDMIAMYEIDGDNATEKIQAIRVIHVVGRSVRVRDSRVHT